MVRYSMAVLATALLAGPIIAPAAAAPEPINAPAEEAVLEKPGVLLDRIAATADEGIITESELQDAIADYSQQLAQRGTALPDREVLRSRVLDILVTQQLQLIRADRMGLKASEEQINQAIRDWAAQQKLEYARLPQLMPDYAAFRDSVRKQLLIEQVTQREVSQRIHVTPRELEQFTARMKGLPDENAEYDVSDILLALPTDATQAQVDEVAKKAQEISRRAATEDFAALAAQYSDAEVGLKGGSLGWLKSAELPSWAVDAIPPMKAGEVSGPISSPWGYHVARLNGVRHGENATRDQVHLRRILMKTNALQDDATVELKLEGIRQRILAGEDFSVFATSLSQDTDTSVNGGEMDWTTPEELGSQKLASIVAGLKDNEISEPFQTDSGWYIVQLLGRRTVDMTEDDLRNNAIRQLYSSKGAEEEQLWLREMRDEAYINLNP
jgi:peptidyl-prolyl cis-trans isomerase SurA